MSTAIEKLKEYAEKGVPNIWLIDPRLQLVWTYCPPVLAEVQSDPVLTSDSAVQLTRAEIFAD